MKRALFTGALVWVLVIKELAHQLRKKWRHA